MSEWIALAPKLRHNSKSRRYFHSFLLQLTKPGYERLDLDRLRAEFLAKADDCGVDRKTLRVLIGVLCDLKSKGWRFRCEDGIGYACESDETGGTVLEQKDRVRSSLLVERDSQLRQPSVRTFVKGMQQRRIGPSDWISIFSLMRDGRELAEKLATARKKPVGKARTEALRKVIDPYLQFVDGEEVCSETGLRLGDIWRYFRHTWATPYTNAPGRKFWIIVRDRAAKHHPVIGIASFGNAVVQLTPRDEWIGWTSRKFLDRLKSQPSREWAVWLYRNVEEMSQSIYSDDFVNEKLISRSELKKPNEEVFARLMAFSIAERNVHDLNPQSDLHKESRVENIDWMSRAKTHLFRSKRAEALVRVLQVRKALNESGFKEPTRKALENLLASSDGRRAIELVLRSVKAMRVGISMMEITICGAIAPYRSILGGKLVAMLLTSPEVVMEYERRYGKACSVIASSMIGKAVQRKPNLVALGTTSLYGAGSAMYNRISIPVSATGGEGDLVVRYQELGKTMGFGSIQFSPETVNEIESLVKEFAGRQINHIFGEGVSPRLRKVRQGLETAGLPADRLLRHGSPRIVYGVALAEQFQDVLLGLRKNRPRYYFPFDDPAKVTSDIANFWIERWLSNRVEDDNVLADAASHTLVYPVTHGAKVDLPILDEDELPLFPNLEKVC
jgi:hypothetical protein